MTKKELCSYHFKKHNFIEIGGDDKVLYKIISTSFLDNTIQIKDNGIYKYIPIENVTNIYTL